MANIHPSLAPTEEKVKALQYLFDIARTAPAPAAVHDQAKQYAQWLADGFNPPSAPPSAHKEDEPAETQNLAPAVAAAAVS